MGGSRSRTRETTHRDRRPRPSNRRASLQLRLAIQALVDDRVIEIIARTVYEPLEPTARRRVPVTSMTGLRSPSRSSSTLGSSPATTTSSAAAAQPGQSTLSARNWQLRQPPRKSSSKLVNPVDQALPTSASRCPQAKPVQPDLIGESTSVPVSQCATPKAAHQPVPRNPCNVPRNVITAI